MQLLDLWFADVPTLLYVINIKIGQQYNIIRSFRAFHRQGQKFVHQYVSTFYEYETPRCFLEQIRLDETVDADVLLFKVNLINIKFKQALYN